jgi:hypothetical protein
MDFVGFNFNVDKCKTVTVQDLVLVCQTVSETKEWKYDYHDFIAQDKSKNDLKYMRTVFKEIERKKIFEGYTDVYIFSDGAGKHFKTSFTQMCAAKLQKALGFTVQLKWVIFAANHGWSICDSHGEVLNQEKTRIEVSGNQPKSALDWINAIQHAKLKNTTVEVIDNIDQSSFDLNTIKGIKSCFYFTYHSTGENHLAVRMFEHSKAPEALITHTF